MDILDTGQVPKNEYCAYTNFTIENHNVPVTRVS